MRSRWSHTPECTPLAAAISFRHQLTVCIKRIYTLLISYVVLCHILTSPQQQRGSSHAINLRVFEAWPEFLAICCCGHDTCVHNILLAFLGLNAPLDFKCLKLQTIKMLTS